MSLFDFVIVLIKNVADGLVYAFKHILNP